MIAPTFAANEGNERNLTDFACQGFFSSPLRDHQNLSFHLPHREDHRAAVSKLIEQGLREDRRGGGNENLVKGSKLGPTDCAVSLLQNGTFYELLKTDVDEGRELYEKRVPAGIKAKKDYFQEAFDNFIKAQGKNVR